MKKNFNIQKKLVNYLTKNGEKSISEKILLKSLKTLQKNSLKKPKKIFQLTLINSIFIFKLHKISNKKIKKRTKKIIEIPAFISNKQSRTFLTIKFILKNIKKKNLKFYQELKKEILLNAINKNSTIIGVKNKLQKYILTKTRYLLFYRWN